MRDSGQVPPILYHYGSPNSLRGIIETGCIWATDRRYLNDTQEHIYATEMLKRVIREYSSDLGTAVIAFYDDIASYQEYGPYIASFSEDGDLLSQWRAYSPANSGLCIGFESATLYDNPRANLAPCEYDTAEQETRIHELIREVIEQFRLRLPVNGPPMIEEWVPNGAAFEVSSALKKAVEENLAPYFKHPAFSEEKEWRLVAMNQGHNSKSDVRIGPNGFIPFEKLPLLGIEHSRGIKEIVVGPTRDLDAAVWGVQVLLMTLLPYDAPRIEVRKSAIPFRA